MVGRLRNQRLLVYGSRTSYGLRRLVSEQNQNANLRLDFTWEMTSNSDHYTFFDASIPTLMFHTDLHDDYHRPRDDSHKINSAGIEQIDRLLFNVVFEMADSPRKFTFRTASRRETVDGQRTMERAAAPLPPRLGVRWNDETATAQGVVLNEIFAGSAAQRSGLRVGDRILQVGGAPVEGDVQLRRLIATSVSPLKAQVQRAGQDSPLEMNIQLAGPPVRLGLTWREDRAEPGVLFVTAVMPGSPAADAGLTSGDRVYRVGGQDFADGEAFRALANSLPSPVELTVERQGRLRTLTLNAPSNEPTQAASTSE
jgi:C-terminal processing protease CtpA/Prc